jgi:hypothetical protein
LTKAEVTGSGLMCCSNSPSFPRLLLALFVLFVAVGVVLVVLVVGWLATSVMALATAGFFLI